MKTSKKF